MELDIERVLRLLEMMISARMDLEREPDTPEGAERWHYHMDIALELTREALESEQKTIAVTSNQS